MKIYKTLTKRIICAGILMSLFAMPTFAIEEIEENSVVTLDECIELAIKMSHNLKILDEKVKITKYNVGVAKSSYVPTLEAGASYGFLDSHSPGVHASTNTFGIKASINQLIFSFGKVLSNVKMQKFYRIAAEYDYNDYMLTTIHNVKHAYYSVIAAEANLEVQVANVQINQRQLARTKAFFEEGLVSRIDVVNEEAYLSEAKISLLNAEKTYRSAIIDLNNAMCYAGAPKYHIEYPANFKKNHDYVKAKLATIGQIKSDSTGKLKSGNKILTENVEKTDLISNFTFKKYDKTFEECLKIAYENRPDYLSLIATEKAAKEYITYKKRSYLPDLKGSAGYNYTNTQRTDLNSFSVGANLSTSNLNFMQINLEIKQAEAQLEIAKQTTEEAKEDIYFDVEECYITLMQLQEKIPLMEEKVMQTLENYELADARYEVGLGNFIELQNAKMNYNNSQQSYIETVYNYNVALVALQDAMGEK